MMKKTQSLTVDLQRKINQQLINHLLETSTSLLGSLPMMYSASGVESVIGGINNIVSVFTASKSVSTSQFFK